MKSNLRITIVAGLLFGLSGLSSAKAITTEELEADLEWFAGLVGQYLATLFESIDDHESRLSVLEGNGGAGLILKQAVVKDSAGTKLGDFVQEIELDGVAKIGFYVGGIAHEINAYTEIGGGPGNSRLATKATGYFTLLDCQGDVYGRASIRISLINHEKHIVSSISTLQKADGTFWGVDVTKIPDAPGPMTLYRSYRDEGSCINADQTLQDRYKFSLPIPVPAYTPPLTIGFE